jgi:aspartate-semialdehyde dehydrogenase
MKTYTIAIVGATGLVGREVIKILEEKNLCDHNFVMLASKKSQGKIVKLNNKDYKVQALSKDNLIKHHPDFALFCVGEDVSKCYVEYLANRGCVVIDFSSAFRNKYPLIVPEVNLQDIDGNIICNPNCSTIGAVIALNKINKCFGLRRIIYSTYQAVSGAGKYGLDALRQNKKMPKTDHYICNNIIPYIGSIDERGYSKEENKMIFETKKIMHLTDIDITATCVRVPVDIGHSESINFTTKQKVDLQDILQVLKKTQGVSLVDFPMPINVKGQNQVLVGRVRQDSHANSFNMMIVVDNLRKGAAQNGVQILEALINVNI